MFITLSPFTERLLREELVKVHADLGAELAQAKPNGDSSKASLWSLAIGRLLTAAFGSTGINPNPEIGRIALPYGGFHFFEPGYAEKYVAGVRRVELKNLYPQLMLREMKAGRWIVDNLYFGSVFEWLMGRARMGIDTQINYTRRALLNMTYGMLFMNRKAPAGPRPAVGSLVPPAYVEVEQWGPEPCPYKLLPGAVRIQLSKAETEICWLTERLYARILPAVAGELIAIDVDEFFVEKETPELIQALGAVAAEYGIEHHVFGCDGVLFRNLKQRMVIDLDGRVHRNSLPKFRKLPQRQRLRDLAPQPQFDLLDTESVIAALSTPLVKVQPFKVPGPVFKYKHLDEYYTMQVDSYDTIVEANFVLQRVIEEAVKLEISGEVLLFEYHNPDRPHTVRRYARFFPANGLPLPERPRGNELK